MNLGRKLLNVGLPAAAILLGAAAVRIIATSKPDDAMVVPVRMPASASGTALGAEAGNSKSAVVAGAGIVEPASELIGVGTPVSGVVKRVDVKVGDRVKAGDALFELDDREAAAEVAARAAGVEVAKANVGAADVDAREKSDSLKLYEAIGDSRAMTRDELSRRTFAAKSATSRLLTAKANLAQSEALLAQASTNRDLRVVRAPQDGTILQLKIRAGEFAPATQLAEPLLTMGRLEPLHVRIDIDEADIGRVSRGKSVTVSPRGASTVRAEAIFVREEPLVVPKRSLTNATTERVDTRVEQLIFALPAGTKGFVVGQQVDAFLPATEGDGT